MSIDISLIPQERIKDLVSTLDIIQNNISTIDGKLISTTPNIINNILKARAVVSSILSLNK